MSSIEEYLKKYNQQTAANTQAKVDAVNNTAAASSQLIKDDYGAQIKETEQTYNQLFDENNVQKIINERQIAESMANTGLTDSGLNRTQMTASQLSHANNQANIRRQQQAAIDTLSRTMQSKLTEIETSRAAQESSIRTADYDSNYALAVDSYNSEQEAIAEQTKALADAISDSQQQQDSDFKAVMNVMGDANATPALKAQWQQWYGTRYGLDSKSLTELFGSTSAKTAYTDDELDSGVTSSGSQIYTDEMISDALKVYHQSDENEQVLADTVDELAQQYGWDPDTEISFYNLLVKRTEGTRQFWLNPHLDHTKYTLMSKSGSANDDGLYLDAVVQDSYGNTWTLKDVYYASRRALAKDKYKDDWENHVNDKSIKKMAVDQVKKIQSNLKIS